MSRPLREVTTFLALAFSIAIGLAVAMPHAGINVLLSAFAPIIAVLIVTFTTTRPGRRRELWASFGLARSGKNVWAIALLLPMVLAVGAYAIAVAVGVAELGQLDVTASGAAGWGLILIVNLVTMTVLFLSEEIGWRAYMLPRVQQLTSRRRAAVVTGFVHGCFHLPLVLIATTYDEFGSRWILAPMVVAVITAGGVFYAYLWDRTHSVWPAAMAHGAVNIAFGLGAAAVVASSQADLAYVAGEGGIATFVVVAIAAVVLLTRAKVWRTEPTDVVDDARSLEKVA
jgi:membrane protease YdiL (CAAX protease family)